MKQNNTPNNLFIDKDSFFAINTHGRYWRVCKDQSEDIDWVEVEDVSKSYMDYPDILDFKIIMEHLEKRIQRRGELLTEEDQQIIKRLHKRIAIFEVPDPTFEQKYIKLNNEKGKLEEYVSIFIWHTDKINWEHIAHAVEYYRSINKKIALKRMLNKLNKEILHMEFSELESKIENVIQEQKQKLEEQSKQEKLNVAPSIPKEESQPKQRKEILQEIIKNEQKQKERKTKKSKSIQNRTSTTPDGLPKELIKDSIDLRKENLTITLQQ